MYKCVAIYPHEINKEYLLKVNNTIDMAFKYGFNEVFTTIHLPEYPLNLQIVTLDIINKKAKEKGMEISVDIGGNYINEVLENTEYINMLKEFNIDYLRLDYGFNFNQVKDLYEKLNVSGFVINASIYNEIEVKEIVDSFYKIDKKIRLKACHNYYLRNESGIDDVFALRQDLIFKKYNIPVYYCIPTTSNPRGPMYLGLCTIEKQRQMDIKDILVDLYLNHSLEAFMTSDEWLTEDEFKDIQETLTYLEKPLNKQENIQIEFYDQVNDKEREIVCGLHRFRYDSPFTLLRSQSSRQMAEFASEIRPLNMVSRKKGDITIDNINNKRYSGEMQVVFKDLKEDERINIVGRVVRQEDLIKLLRFKEGITYNFIEAKYEN